MWRAILGVTGIFLGLFLLWVTADALLLVFAAVLMAVLLRTLSDALVRFARIPHKLSLPLTVLLLVAFFTFFVVTFVPQIAGQIRELRETLPRVWDKVTAQLTQYEWAQGLFQEAPSFDNVLSGSGRVFSRVTGAVSGTLGALANLAIIVVLALFLAADPKLYENGLIRLFPVERRPRMREVYRELGVGLRGWLLGQLAGMAIIGTITGIGLAIIGVPLTLALVFLVVLLNFIPNIGPLIALAPAALLALTGGWKDALWVIALYFGAQTLEGNFLTPLIQQKTVDIPPAVTISAQLLFGLLFGFMGVALATPLAVAAMVLIRMLYIEDTLGDYSDTPAKFSQ